MLSGGRLLLGVGVGGEYPPEFEAVGASIAERGPRTDEAIEILRRHWTEQKVEHHGRFHDFGPVKIEPKPGCTRRSADHRRRPQGGLDAPRRASRGRLHLAHVRCRDLRVEPPARSRATPGTPAAPAARSIPRRSSSPSSTTPTKPPTNAPRSSSARSTTPISGRPRSATACLEARGLPRPAARVREGRLPALRPLGALGSGRDHRARDAGHDPGAEEPGLRAFLDIPGPSTLEERRASTSPPARRSRARIPPMRRDDGRPARRACARAGPSGRASGSRASRVTLRVPRACAIGARRRCPRSTC